MIQYKKIPPSKSVILLLLFLTTNTCGFQRETQNEYEISRKIQSRYSMDLQQSQNMPIRRVGIDRVINEKDGNAERLYDRRSFRTGTIERTDDIRRSIEGQHRARVDVRADLNNNREFFTRNSQLQNTRYDRRSFESTISRNNRQRQPEDRRFGERAVITRNRQYDEGSLETRTERDLDRRGLPRSSNIRDRRNVRDLDRRISETRTADELRSTSTQRIEDERREVRDRQLQARRISDRELPQRQIGERRSIENRVSETPIETRRSVRLVDARARRSSEQNLNQRRSLTERYSRENPLDRRFVENRDRNVDQRRSSLERDVNRVRTSTERLERMNSRLERINSRLERINSRLERIHSSELLERRSVERSNRRTSEIRNIDQRQLSSEERNEDQIRASTRLISRERRSVENENLDRRDQRRSSSKDRMEDKIRSSTERLEEMISRQNPSQRRTVTSRITERRENPSADRLERTNSRENRRSLETRDRIISERQSRLQDTRRFAKRNSRERQFSTSRNTEDIRTTAQEGRAGEQHWESRRLSRAHRVIADSVERHDQRIQDSRRTTDRLQRISSQDRTISLQRRERDVDERRANNARRLSFNDRQLSRSDSTRYIQDNINSRNIRLTYRKDSTRDSSINENSRRENIRITDRYNPITADSRRYFEKIVSQRTTGDSVRNTEIPALGLERNINNNDTYTWGNTVKLILAAFLVGQIFVNSSKANRFRFHNILSMATSIKEKVQ